MRSPCSLLIVVSLVVGVGSLRADDAAPGVDLSQVTDRTDLAYEEADAYYALLAHARQVPLEALRTVAARDQEQRRAASERFQQYPPEDFPLFYDLTQRPEEYRGRPITMRGHLIRLVKQEAGPNDHGIDTLYEGWLVTPDSANHPATIVCTEIPPGMPIGEELIDGVSVTGYFFKLHTYNARDQRRFAPLVLAHRMIWSPQSDAETGWPVSQQAMMIGIVLIALIGIVVAVLASRRSRQLKEQRFRESVPDTPPDFLNELNS